MAAIKIDSSGACTTISVDGQRLGHVVTKIAVEMEAGSLPVVRLDLAAFQNALELSNARIKIGGIEAPEALERAMLEHLQDKYAHLAPRNVITVHCGSLPTAEDMAPAVRSVVQSIAADLVKLPVREMGAPEPRTFIPEGVTLTAEEEASATSKPAPAIKFPIATDGERNGRMAWVPGA